MASEADTGATTGMPLAQRIRRVPVIHDRDRAERFFSDLVDREAEGETGPLQELLRANDKAAALVKALYGNSPFLSSLIERDPASLYRALTKDPDQYLEALTGALLERLAVVRDDKEAQQALRLFKKDVALLIALADLSGVWMPAVVTWSLAIAADAAITSAFRYLLRRASEAGRYFPKDKAKPETGSGLIVLAMGKHGAFELNYSSDIDLIVFFEKGRARLSQKEEEKKFFIRLTRSLVKLMQERTADGYVFRTDLRLRPDPGATAVAISADAAFSYYESFGQNWERAAMIKARAAAGDIPAGERFLEQLGPYVWRRYLDFAAIADVHAMKRQVHAFKGHGEIAIAGHNIKLGRGGIREIEFFVQTQQLIAGGRQPELRTRSTIEGLTRLAAGKWIDPRAAQELGQAYWFLRKIEHRLQMINDEQTHTLPGDEDGLARVAHFSGFENVETFSSALREQLETVQRHYSALFEDVPELTGGVGNLVFTGDEDDTETLETLSRMGFANPVALSTTVRNWHYGRYRAVSSERARERLTELVPPLLQAFAESANPDAALMAFDRFLSELPAGVQLFSLLCAHPQLLRLLADIMGTAPRLARVLSRRARVLDAVLDPGFFGALPDKRSLDEKLSNAVTEAGDFQGALDHARIAGSEQSFLIGVRILTGTITADQAGAAYANLAESAIRALQDEVEKDITRRHGRLANSAVAVLAMGKLGGREVTAASDLDLIVIYDYDPDVEISDGRKPLMGVQYYSRLTQRLISALTAPTGEGSLYEVDMRLRPSGRSGPVATRLDSFISYQNETAWTWEHMALTRARVISGPEKLRERIETTIRDVLMKPRDQERVVQDVAKMRERIREKKGTDDIWKLKQVRGGLVDLEFITQYLQLIHAARHPDILDQNTAHALMKMSRAGVLETDLSELLINAAWLYHNLTQVLRLCFEGSFSPDAAPDGLRRLLAGAGDVPDFSRLEVHLSDTLARVADVYDRLIGSHD